MDVDKFRQYKIYDGKHMLALEHDKLIKETDSHHPNLFGDCIQMIYRFPNDYGVSIVKGKYLSSGIWEAVFIQFHSFNEDYDLISEPERFREWEIVQDFLAVAKSWDKRKGKLK